jgi:hypothetical protein
VIKKRKGRKIAAEKERPRKDRRVASQVIKEEIVPYKTNFLCMRFLGGSLGVTEKDGLVTQCNRGSECIFQHKSASMTTLVEAQEAMEKTKNSARKRDIQKAMDAFNHFKK